MPMVKNENAVRPGWFLSQERGWILYQEDPT
jgi:hypothetical protein